MGNIRIIHTSPGIYTSIRSVPRHDNNYVLQNTKALGGYKNQSGAGGRGGGGDVPITTVWVFGNAFPAVFA